MRRAVFRELAGEQPKPVLEVDKVRVNDQQDAAGVQPFSRRLQENARVIEVMQDHARNHAAELRVEFRESVVEVKGDDSAVGRSIARQYQEGSEMPCGSPVHGPTFPEQSQDQLSQ